MLLDSSVDAITYVHDGMHIYANRSYMALFGYEDAEELEGLPVIDLIASCDQGAFKDFLKGYQNDQRQTELVCTGVKLDGQEFKARISLSAATYDGEPCIQVVIRGEVDNAELEEKLREVSSQDPVLRVDPSIADLRVTGSFPLKDTRLALQALEPSLPVRSVRHNAWWFEVVPR